MVLHEPLNEPRVAKLTVDHFMRLDAERAFGEVSKTELIDGVVYTMNAQYRRHALAKTELYDAIRDALKAIGSDLRPIVECAVEMPPHSVLEPDIVLTSEPGGEGWIPVRSVALVIEVADTTARHDLETKAAAYASAGVPECWVVDLNAATAHQLSAPEGGAYRTHDRLKLGDPIESATIDGLAVDTAAV